MFRKLIDSKVSLVFAVLVLVASIALHTVLGGSEDPQLQEANQEIARLQQEVSELEQENADAEELLTAVGVGVGELLATNEELETANAELELVNKKLLGEARFDEIEVSLYRDRMAELTRQYREEFTPVEGDNSSPWKRYYAFEQALNTQNYATAYNMTVSSFRNGCTLEEFSRFLYESGLSMSEDIVPLDQHGEVSDGDRFAMIYFTTGFEWSNKFSEEVIGFPFFNEDGQWMIPVPSFFCSTPEMEP